MKPRLSIPYIGWMTIFVVAPLILVVFFAFTSPDGVFTLANFSQMGEYGSIFYRSFVMAFISTIICLVLGYPMAYILSRQDERHQPFYMMLIMLPMWMNFLLRTYAWVSVRKSVV